MTEQRWAWQYRIGRGGRTPRRLCRGCRACRWGTPSWNRILHWKGLRPCPYSEYSPLTPNTVELIPTLGALSPLPLEPVSGRYLNHLVEAVELAVGGPRLGIELRALRV